MTPMHIHKSNNTRRKTVKLTAVAERPLPVKHAGRRRRGEAPLGVGILMTPGWFAKARKWPEYAIGLKERVHLDGGEISAKDLDPDDMKILKWLFEKRTGLACAFLGGAK